MISRTPLARLACAALLSAVVLGACGDDSATEDTILPPPKFVMSYIEGDNESQFLEEVYAQALSNPDGANFRVSRLNPMPTLDALLAAMEADRLQVLPVYSQQLLTLLRTKAGRPAGTMPAALADQVKEIHELLPKGLSMGTASTGEHKQSIACTTAIVEKHTLVSLTALAKPAPELVLGAPAGFDTATPLGAGTLQSTYGITFKSVIPVADDAAITAAVKDKTADCFVIDSGSATLVKSSLTVLKDDKSLVPANAVIPLFQLQTPAEVPLVVDQVTERVTTTNLSSILSLMSGGMAPHVAAKSFLETAQPDPVPDTAPPGSAPAGSAPAGSAPAGPAPAGTPPAGTTPATSGTSATTPAS